MESVQKEFAAVLAERTRIAREMHDTVIQNIVGSVALLAAADGSLRSSPERTNDLLKRARRQLQQTLNDLRTAVWNLRSQAVAGDELTVRLEQELRLLTDETAVRFNFDVIGSPFSINDQAAENILRIGQEAVLNILKHARATRITVQLEFGLNDLVLKVADDGRGFSVIQFTDVAEAQQDCGNHFGLLGMQERAAEIGGNFQIISIVDGGTFVSLRVPLENATAAQ